MFVAVAAFAKELNLKMPPLIAIGETKDFQGATGVITINDKRDAVKSAVILELKDGRPQYVSTVKP